uniref:Uncharacterized protein n=1 Tax=Trichogramma kaykai TaxID=54128 RepID=A0ABD2VZX7_9HYME
MEFRTHELTWIQRGYSECTIYIYISHSTQKVHFIVDGRRHRSALLYTLTHAIQSTIRGHVCTINKI